MSDQDLLTWPVARGGELLEHLASTFDMAASRAGASHLAPPPGTELMRWIEAAVSAQGLEAGHREVLYGGVEETLSGLSPGLVLLDGEKAQRLLAILSVKGDSLIVLSPAGETSRVARPVVAAWCRSSHHGHLAAAAERVLDAAGLAGSRRENARGALLAEQLRDVRVADAWAIAAPPGTSFRRQLRIAGLPAKVWRLGVSHAVQHALWIASWWLLGQAVLDGRLDWGWIAAWTLLLATIVPLQAYTTWLQGLIAVRFGELLKRRLMAGALRLDPDEIRHEGAGQFLGRVIESEAVEALALNAGVLTGLAAIELLFAMFVVGQGAAGGWHTALLALWVVLLLASGHAYLIRRQTWSESRLLMTHDLVEGIGGHRTRLVQQDAERWHDDEDRALARYASLARQMDRTRLLLVVAAPRGWLIASLLVITPAFVEGSATPVALAVSLGGTILAYTALRSLADGLGSIAGAAVAWAQAAPLFAAAGRPLVAPSPNLAGSNETPGPPDRPGPVIEARDLVFRHGGRVEPVLRGCSLDVLAGDRILLDGPSGSGKSTLAAILAGLRTPDAGLLLARGLDLAMLGRDGWRRRVVLAPQFHDNHVLAETFAFNGLMGRRWPATARDLADLEELCDELGLGDLIRQMPSGVLQMVGDAGWRMSHGEQSRLFIARALLQNGDVLIFDESFAALDPDSLLRSLRCARARAAALLLITHR